MTSAEAHHLCRALHIRIMTYFHRINKQTNTQNKILSNDTGDLGDFQSKVKGLYSPAGLEF